MLLMTFSLLSCRLLFYNSNPWRLLGHTDHREEEIGWCSRYIPPPRTHTNIIAVCKKKAKNCFKVLLILLLPLLKLWLIRQETSSLTVTTRWTVRRISMQQAPSLNTADLWTCMRLVSSTLLPKAPLTNPSIFWYTLPFPPLLLNSMI